MFWAQQSHINFNVHKHGQALAIIARENSDILPCHPWFPRKMMSEKQHRNSILMTRHYSDLGSASDWLKQISHAAQPIRSTTQIWGEMRHQYGISALVSQTSFRGQISGGVAKCRLFSQGRNLTVIICFGRHGHVNCIFSTDSPAVKAEWVTTLNTSKLRLCKYGFKTMSW